MAVKSTNIQVPDLVTVKRALLSVSNKSGIIDLATRLTVFGIGLVSTGGTAKAISDAGLAVKDISEVTGFPEIMDGRVKTLHPLVHGGLLAIRDDSDHKNAMAEHNIEPIDLLIVNLYPFEKTVASGASYADCVENIDIGGPAMIRASAKNHAYVTVLTDPSDYTRIEQLLTENDGKLPLAFRKEMAAKAFALTAAYDTAISAWFAGQNTNTPLQLSETKLPQQLFVSAQLAEILRYGENPHQMAGFYKTKSERPGVATAVQLQGKQLSYNNINDTDAAFELVSEFDPSSQAVVAIIKHANPCGVATGGSLKEAYLKAYACDSVSAFGGIVATNQKLDADAANEIVKVFTEVIIAPEIDDAAKAIIANKKNLRLLITGALADPVEPGQTIKSVSGGFLVQSKDNGQITIDDLKIVTKRKPTKAEMADMIFAFRVAKHVKSNAIVYVKDGATVGIGAGQMSRLDSSRIAARKAEDARLSSAKKTALTHGSVVASDAFFPFADGLISAIEAGATAAIQPGGSMRDKEVIEAADAAGVAMVFTGMRHFRH